MYACHILCYLTEDEDGAMVGLARSGLGMSEVHMFRQLSTPYSPPPSHRHHQACPRDDDLSTSIYPHRAAPPRSASVSPASLETCTVHTTMTGKRETYPYAVSSPYSAPPTTNPLIYWTRCASASEDDCVHPAMPDGRSQVGRTPIRRNIVTPAQIREPATSVHSSRAWCPPHL